VADLDFAAAEAAENAHWLSRQQQYNTAGSTLQTNREF
jgi:hypothetical protein